MLLLTFETCCASQSGVLQSSLSGSVPAKNFFDLHSLQDYFQKFNFVVEVVQLIVEILPWSKILLFIKLHVALMISVEGRRKETEEEIQEDKPRLSGMRNYLN